MRKAVISVLGAIVLVFLLTGCVVSGLWPNLTALAVEERMIRGVNALGISLVRELWGEKETNVFLSPVGIEMALAMAAGGARGKTQVEMLEVLGLGGMTEESIGENNLNLVKMLNRSGAHVEVRTANSLWARQGVPFYESFLAHIRRYYQAEAEVVDFANPGVIDRINQWVKKATGGKIDRMLDRIPQEAILVLLNAIYFKGKWLYPFNPEKTELLPFYPLSGGAKSLPTMWQRRKFRYAENQKLQAVCLPYGDSGFSMYIVLPRERDGVGELVRSLTVADLEAIIGDMREREGEVYLPRFTITFEETLNQTLQKLGIREAFDEYRADFSGMLPIPPVAYLSEVRHKSVLEVTEEGTEAAGVTSVIVGITAAPLEEPFLLRVDHPFILCIREEGSGLFLFLGVVTDPEAL